MLSLNIQIVSQDHRNLGKCMNHTYLNYKYFSEICENWEWQCESGECISKTQRCDRIPNCPDATDELDCPPLPIVPDCNNLTQFSCGYVLILH